MHVTAHIGCRRWLLEVVSYRRRIILSVFEMPLSRWPLLFLYAGSFAVLDPVAQALWGFTVSPRTLNPQLRPN